MTQKQAKNHMARIADFYGKIEKKKANKTQKTGKNAPKMVFISDQFAESEHKVASEMATA